MAFSVSAAYISTVQERWHGQRRGLTAQTQRASTVHPLVGGCRFHPWRHHERPDAQQVFPETHAGLQGGGERDTERDAWVLMLEVRSKNSLTRVKATKGRAKR